MSDELVILRPEPTAAQLERDTADNADAFVLLDDASVRLAICDGCGEAMCRCCSTCGTWPCRCGPPLSQREVRAMYARHGIGPAREVPQR